MKLIFCSLLLIFPIITINAQIVGKESLSVMAFDKFQPAIVTMNNGNTIKTMQANIFLKNGKLLFKRGKTIMEAHMDGIASVDIAGYHYLKNDTCLSFVVDTLGRNKLLCTTLIDMESFRHQMINNKQVTDLEIATMVGVTTLDLFADEDLTYPTINYFYFDIDGKIINAEERSIMKSVDKDKRRIVKSIIEMPGFTWSNVSSLMKLLEVVK